MTDSDALEAPDEGNIEDFEAVFGTEPEQPPVIQSRRDFAPWHHPVKQLIRKRQWADLTVRLLGDLEPTPSVLRYFTMPGPDLLDVRVLSDVSAARNIPVEFFGFDSAGQDISGGAQSRSDEGAAAIARAALRQAGRITGESVVLKGRVEDIVYDKTHASTQLLRQQPFHVVNLDACSHLTKRSGDIPNLFDALKVLLQHQLRADFPWLLFLTTRCDPTLLFDAGDLFKERISENLRLSPDGFGDALASLLETERSDLDQAIAAAWGREDSCFSKMYCVGLGKFLLHLYNGQPNSPADVELVSAYAYNIHPEEPKMLALAFRITPAARQMFPPSIGGMVATRQLEPERAIRVAEKAAKLWLLDEAMRKDEAVRKEALEGTAALLRSAGYDIDAWERWLGTHSARPIDLSEPAV